MTRQSQKTGRQFTLDCREKIEGQNLALPLFSSRTGFIADRLKGEGIDMGRLRDWGGLDFHSCDSVSTWTTSQGADPEQRIHLEWRRELRDYVSLPAKRHQGGRADDGFRNSELVRHHSRFSERQGYQLHFLYSRDFQDGRQLLPV